jgi:hypothetical protein
MPSGEMFPVGVKRTVCTLVFAPGVSLLWSGGPGPVSGQNDTDGSAQVVKFDIVELPQ